MGFGNIGLSGLLLILVVLLIFFGPSKLPEIGKAFGKSLREFKNATNGMMEDAKEPLKATETVAAQSEANSSIQPASASMEPIVLHHPTEEVASKSP